MTAARSDLRKVRVRTTAVAMLTVVVVLAVGAFALVQFFERQQIQQLDERLAATSRLLPSLPSGSGMMTEELAGDALVQVVDDSGRVGFAGDRLRGQPAMRSTATDPSEPVTAEIAGVGRARAVAVPFGENWVLFAESLEAVDSSTSDLVTVLLFGLPVLALILGALVWIVVGRTLRPVRDAMDRERRLVADVSHELRTPIAGARALLESESTVPAEIELNRLEALAVLTRLETLTSDLLVEARADANLPTAPTELVDLDDVVFQVAELVGRRDQVVLDVSGVSAGQVRGSHQDLERMVSNLVSNALRHARSVVTIGLSEDGADVVLTVSDDGAGIATEDRDRVFERFTRLDDARSRDGAGAGLGLAIVTTVVDAHGGSIEVRDAAGGGAMFVVTIPSASGRPTDAPVRTPPSRSERSSSPRASRTSASQSAATCRH